ncbi:TPA: fimbrial biogenesis outer membrane usher protein [Providencia rettgeri]|nr:fimbrial biogenesis outer membrane usher protein [Providencia rettgeri]HEC8346577.1 fimbrial biogenesis outer membrane usher protein [Providencia rettgeri]HEM6921922.1 fimbrial biogenesis outer membrane usher protein [Providencia rettgeri]
MRCIPRKQLLSICCANAITCSHNWVMYFRLKKVCQAVAAIIFTGMNVNYAFADDYFSPSSLSVVDGQNIADLPNLNQFANPGGQLAGEYHVDVIVNGILMESKVVEFIKDKSSNQLIPLLTKEELALWGVKVDAIPALKALPEKQEIVPISEYIPDAKSILELNQQKLNISIPQIAMDKQALGTVPTSQWENGVPALVLNYYYSGSNNWSRNKSKDSNSHYFNLRSTGNLGPWRLKNYSTYTDNNGKREWENIETSLERGINYLKSQLTIGDTATPSEIFEGFQFRGVQLRSDESMLPSSMRGFAPVIRGIAQSNAEVTVKQNNYVIYQSYVSPGAFEIDDLYPTGTSGDLTVLIKEADGSERSFVVPFSSIAIMQREGQLKYSLTGGKYKSNTAGEVEPNFLQSTFIYGLPKSITGYAGTLLSKNYQSYAAGMGINLGSFGALSADITQANSQNLLGKDNTDSGQSYRFQYSKNVTSTGTSVTLANYRYSTEGFYTFSEANSNQPKIYRNNKKNRFQVSLNQSLNEFGNVYFSSYQQDYWNRSGKERSLNAGYNNNIGGITYNFSYSYTDSAYQRKADNYFSFSMTIPLNDSSGNYTSINSSVTADNSGNTDAMMGISGTLGESNNFNYAIQQSYGNKETRASGNASASYRGSYGVANAAYGYDKYSQRANYGLTGAVVAHPHGITLSQPINDTFAIVRAPGAKNVQVSNRANISTDSRGYAIIPYLNPYTKNEITLNIDSLPDNVELKTNTVSVVPTKGAAILASYQTHVGYRLLFTVTHNGKPVPFGAMAQFSQSDDQNISTGIVGDNGDVYLSGMPEQGQLQIKWGKSLQEQCIAEYQLTAEQLKQHLPILPVNCH